jgi:lysozyme
MRKINQVGLDLVKQSEGLRLTVYRDVAGFATVGYGHKSDRMQVGNKITAEAAEQLLEQDLVAAESAVMSQVKVLLNDNQFSALVDFVFNLGAGSLEHSTLLKLLNAGNYSDAAGEFAKWDHAGGSVVEALVKRRAAEAELFLS